MITLDELTRQVPGNGTLFRAVIAKHLTDQAAMLNIMVLAGQLSDPMDHDIWPAGSASDTFFAAAVMLSELARDAPINEVLAFAHGMCRFAVAFRLMEARERMAPESRSLQ